MHFRPVVIHYHLFPGGVSTAIFNGLLHLYHRKLIQDEIIFLVGSREKSEWFFKLVREQFGDDINIGLEVIPELFYSEDSEVPVFQAARKIKNWLSALTADDRVFWAHNPTLGKNPAYPLALKMLSEEHPEAAIWMHVHDSAEQGRWPNLHLMQSELGNSWYFISPGTRWLTINRTDHRFFLESGMPSEHCFYVPDPMPVRTPEKNIPRKEIAEALARDAATHHFSLDGNARWFLFAGRTIRRKNLFEALLVTLLCPEKAQLLITLPSDSADDESYEKSLYQALRKFQAGVGGFGPFTVGRQFDLNDLALSSDLILSSSVMEGFGLPYLEFPMLGKPVLARRIPVMDDFISVTDSLPHHFYDGFKIPCEPVLRGFLRERYLGKVERLGEYFGISSDRLEKASDFFKDHFSNDTIDFSYLPISQQTVFLDQLTPSGLAALRNLNAPLVQMMDEALADTKRNPETVRNSVDSLFGFDVFTHNIEKILKSCEHSPHLDFDAAAFAKNLRGLFFTPENLRLLLDYRTL